MCRAAHGREGVEDLAGKPHEVDDERAVGDDARRKAKQRRARAALAATSGARHGAR